MPYSQRLLEFLVALLRRRTRLFTILALCVPLGFAGCGQLVQKERELLFRVVPGTASWYGGMPEGVVEMNLPVATGESRDGNEHINAWWWPAANPSAPAVLYLHGARWNLTGQLFRIEQLHDFGFSVLAIDYRGFGKSSGELPSEETVYEDARLAWQHLKALQPDPRKRLIYGHSLGGAIAIDLASQPGQQQQARGLIVESTFTTLADIAKSLSYPWLPLQLLLSQKFDAVDKIAQVGMPVLIVHGTSDRYVPSHFSEKLYAAAPQRKKLLLVEGGTHNNSMRIGESAYRRAFRELFGLNPAPA
ncbi:alpha/beta hydrolase [Noviherbaspirillum soli]|uniref:alpha/beta hydrolase n=1 Tax=Noviherbaspirillum soli TaxID=1064518 RepID=UPI00188BA1A1|nr:alpha/beta fold hydrolase [Noviherbaspirillum soli]